MYMSFKVIGEAYTSIYIEDVYVFRSNWGGIYIHIKVLVGTPCYLASLIDELFTVFYIHAFLDSFHSICMNSTALDIVNCCFGYCEMLCICHTGFTYLGSSFLFWSSASHADK
ncbi:hypothetical protein Syun_018616 [Stephania yunnanensis]|uniref:Uncharacterized protein n=1 Tax=Stephania yunnanensis TaxID=152371 RepID=A0AAP0NWI4_9MAGN